MSAKERRRCSLRSLRAVAIYTCAEARASVCRRSMWCQLGSQGLVVADRQTFLDLSQRETFEANRCVIGSSV